MRSRAARKCERLTLLAATLLAAAAAPVRAGGPDPVEVRSAVERAAHFLAARIGPDGRARDEYAPDRRERLHGGRTALVCYALLAAGENEKSEPLAGALEWLAAAELDGTYPVALRTCAFAEVWDRRFRAVLDHDVEWLLAAAGPDGAFDYTPRTAEEGRYDNSCTQMAAFALWRAAHRGAEVPRGFWRSLRQHLLDDQQPDGGWAYRIPPGAVRARPYGSMTAAGLATMYACQDVLSADEYVRCRLVPEYEPIARAHAWLGERFAADENPGKGVEWYTYWLFCVGRAGRASGYKYFGEHDWYAEGAAELLSRQNRDGSWGFGDASQRTETTAFALLFLVRSSAPVVATKLRYDGKWNARPRDLANLTRWLSVTYERTLGWQVLPADASLPDWREAPILYVSGAGACELSDEQVERMRDFALQGGLIVSEAACSSGSFSLDMRKAYERMFPEWPLERIDRDHPLFSVAFSPAAGEGLAGVSNGVRLLAIHAPRELSLGLQMGPAGEHLGTYKLMANVYLLATGRGRLLPRGGDRWPAASDVPTRRTIRVARVRHEGNCDPEPMAWKRLTLLAARDGLALEVAGPMPPAKLDAERWPVAAVTGTGDPKWGDEDLAALRRYVAEGGSLIVDAAGGAEAFADSAREWLPALVPGGRLEALPGVHPILTRRGGSSGKHADRRGGAGDASASESAARDKAPGAPACRTIHAQTLGEEAASKVRLEAVFAPTGDGDRRLAVLFSRDDVTAGLVGYPGFDIRGYTPESCVRLMLSAAEHMAETAPE